MYLLFRLNGISPSLLSTYLNEDRLEPWEVTFLYQTNYLMSAQTEEFLLYSLNQLSAAKMDSLNLSPARKMDSLFLQCSLHMAFQVHPDVQTLFCECGKARPGSNNTVWKWQGLLSMLVDHICEHYIAADRLMVLKFCEFCEKSG